MKLTIITINYNNCSGLKVTINSVLSQSCQDFEWIIVDGGSTDGSREFIEDTEKVVLTKGPCVKEGFKWISEKDDGIYNAMNKGITKSHGDYLYFLNSGDALYDNNVLQDVLKFLDGKTCIIVGRIQIDGGKISAAYPRNYSFYHLTYHTYPHQSSFIARSAFDRYGLYNENLRIVSDWEFFIKAVVHGTESICLLDRVIANMEGGGLSIKADEKLREEGLLLRGKYFSNQLLIELERSQSLSEVLEASLLTRTLYRLLYRISVWINTHKKRA